MYHPTVKNIDVLYNNYVLVMCINILYYETDWCRLHKEDSKEENDYSYYSAMS